MSNQEPLVMGVSHAGHVIEKPSYEAYVSACNEAVQAAARTSGVVSFTLIDIDSFGKLNELHGTDVGDGVLEMLANYLVDGLGDSGQVFRYGGDAYSAVLPGVEKEQAFLRIERVRQGLDRSHVVESGANRVELAFTISAGIANYPDDGVDVTDLVRKANEAMCRAKVNGRNKVCLAREERMVTKTSHYTQGQLHGLSRLAKRQGIGEAELLREALDDLLRKYNA